MRRLLPLAFLGSVGLGVVIGWHLRAPASPEVEPPAPEVRQEDGSLILERAAPPKSPEPAPHALPPGGVEERRVQVTVKPKAPLRAPELEKCPDPAPVRLDLSLVRMPDDSRRVVASSPDGEVLAGLDVPLQPLPRVEATRNALGLTAGLPGPFLGVFYDRDLGPFRLGLTAGFRTGHAGGVPPGPELHLRAGVRF